MNFHIPSIKHHWTFSKHHDWENFMKRIQTSEGNSSDFCILAYFYWKFSFSKVSTGQVDFFQNFVGSGAGGLSELMMYGSTKAIDHPALLNGNVGNLEPPKYSVYASACVWLSYNLNYNWIITWVSYLSSSSIFCVLFENTATLFRKFWKYYKVLIWEWGMHSSTWKN